MIKVLERAIEKAKALPPEQQEMVAELIEQITNAGSDVYHLTTEERRLVEEGLAELDRGEGVGETEARAVFEKYRA